jgi:acyl-CoA synthetase (AMP-forming)/AMP-acid ligase II
VTNNTFLDVLEKLADAREDRGLTFVSGDGAETFLSHPALWAELSKRGRQLLACGVAQGDRVAIVIPEPDQFILTFLGAVAVGLVPVPLYPPLALAKIDSYLDGTARILNAAAADLLVTTTQVEKVLWAVMPRVASLKGLVTVEKLAKMPETTAPRPQILPSDPVFLQFTSGSTAAPKGVIVTHKSLVANTTAIVTEGLQVSGENNDIAVSWLPLYHDMGLIGFVLAPLVTLVATVYIPTLAFVRRPRMWFDVIHKHRATASFAPNFAFARITKRATETDLQRWDLSSLRVLGCGAEPIHPATMRAFVDKFAPCKLKPETLLPCYGMAEATLAITFIGMDEQMKTDRHDSLELVSCGRPFSGHEIGIFDEDGRRAPEGMVGEIRLRGPSVAGGYFRNPEATRATFLADGWLRTGDLGYLRGGELYISGRQKDLIIIHGRNYHPQAIEWQVEEVPGVRKGNVVAFSVPGADTEELVIVAEISGTDAEQRAQLADKIKAHLSSTLSLAAADVVLLRPGELPKTTSGKLQRRKTRDQYLQKTLAKDGVRTFGSTADRLALARHYMVGLASRMTHGARSLWRAMRRK